MSIRRILFSTACLFIITTVGAQDTTNLMNQLEKESAAKTTYTSGTFKSTRLINGHTTEITPPHTMDLRISHRFGLLNSGLYNFFGLDEAHMRLGFDFGITKNLMVGIGHNTHIGTYDGYFKVRILKQSKGQVNMPVTVSFLAGIAINSQKKENLEASMFTQDHAYTVNNFSDRVSDVFQLLIARKFTEGLALQLMPTLIHHDNIYLNDVQEISVYKNINAFAIGAGGRQRLSRRVHVTAEYYYQLPSTKTEGTRNSLSFGVDIGTGGHVFQLHVTNSRHMLEQSFITETTGRWDKGDILFGFNILRVFHLKKEHTKSWKG
jgi:hypothetical protein